MAVEERDFGRAEAFFIKAKKPDLAMQMYKDAKYVLYTRTNIGRGRQNCRQILKLKIFILTSKSNLV